MRAATQLEHDLQQYATNKVYNVCRDVVQAYEIAGISNRIAGACLGQLFLRMSATLAVEIGPLEKHQFMHYCNAVYDLALQAAKEDSE